MNETEPQSAEAQPVPAVTEQAQPERSAVGVDLANRPESAWLDTVASELNDTDLVLKCLARDSAKICQTCDVAQGAGELEARPILARCASTKQPR